MEEAVLNRIRNILTVYRDTKQGKKDEPYGWGDLVGEINELHKVKNGVELGFEKNALENCVRGLVHPDKDKRKAGLRKYSKPRPERLDAMVDFLTDKDSEGYFCSKEELFRLPQKQAPVFLLSYLHDDKTPDHYFSAESLQGNFESNHYDAIEMHEVQSSIKFLSATSNSLVLLDIYIGAPSSEDEADVYSGWGVITPEENLIIVAQNTQNKKNLHYLSLGIDKGIYSGPDPDTNKSMVLIEHEYPMDDVNVESPADGKEMLQQVREIWNQKIRLFERQSLNNFVDKNCKEP